MVVFLLPDKDTKNFALMQINGEKVAIFWCKVYGVKAGSTRHVRRGLN